MPWFSAAILLAALLLLGVIAGGLVATRVIGTAGMGWDRIADTVGGIVVGGALGLVAWVVAVRTLGPAGRLRLAAAAGAAAVAAALLLRFTEPAVRSSVAEETPPPPVAPFTLVLGVADGLVSPPAAGDRLPWTTLRIGSNLSMDYVPAEGRVHCAAPLAMNTPEGIAALTELRVQLAALPSDLDCGDPCPSCREVTLQWHLDQPQAVMITDRCWRSHQALQPLRASVEHVFATYRASAQCEASPAP